MATKTINGTYASGYYLRPAYTRLDVGPAGVVEGAGITTGAAAIIDNAGYVDGITLAHGGAVINQASGGIGLITLAAAGMVTNEGVVASTPAVGGTAPVFYSVLLQDGGRVVNGSSTDITASIGSGVQIEGATGIVRNDGTIGGPSRYDVEMPDDFEYLPSLNLGFGGTVVNGEASDTKALLRTGIVIARSAGTVANYGSIGSSIIFNRYGIGGEYFGGYGVQLQAGGRVTNGTAVDRTAAITAIGVGVDISGAPGTVVNFGSIMAIFGHPTEYYTVITGVELADGGRVSNGTTADTGAEIYGNAYGVRIAGAPGMVTNFGTIEAKFIDDDVIYSVVSGIDLADGGQVVNGGVSDAGALISGTASGVKIAGAPGIVTNFGTIEAKAIADDMIYAVVSGVDLADGGLVVNGSAQDLTALISGTADGVKIDGAAGTVSNFGTIDGLVALDAGGRLQNGTRQDAAALVLGGVTLGAPGEVIAFGTIDGNVAAALSFGSSRDVLLLEAGTVFDGAVMGGGGRLRLGAAGGAGTLTGLGSLFTGFGTVDIDQGAEWSLDGSNSLAAGTGIELSGTLQNAGTLSLEGSVRFGGAGVFENDSGASLEIASGAALTFAGGADILAGTISGSGSLVLEGRSLLEAGLSLGISRWVLAGAEATLGGALSFGGWFTDKEGATLALNRQQLDLAAGSTAVITDGTFVGRGTVTSAGRTVLSGAVLAGPMVWDNSGTATATGTVTFGTASGHTVEFRNEAEGVLALDGDVGIATGPAPGSWIDNEGLLEKSAGTGVGIIAVALRNDGMVKVTAGTLDLAGTVSGHGTIEIADNTALDAGSAIGQGQTIEFLATGTLVLAEASLFKGAVKGFAASDTLDLAGFGTGTTIGYSGGADGGTLSVTDGTLTASIALLGQYMAGGFRAASDGHGGTAITYTPPPDPSLRPPLATSG